MTSTKQRSRAELCTWDTSTKLQKLKLPEWITLLTGGRWERLGAADPFESITKVSSKTWSDFQDFSFREQFGSNSFHLRLMPQFHIISITKNAFLYNAADQGMETWN